MNVNKKEQPINVPVCTEENTKFILVCDSNEQCPIQEKLWESRIRWMHANGMLDELLASDPKDDDGKVIMVPNHHYFKDGIIYLLHESLNQIPNDIIGGFLAMTDYHTRLMVYHRYVNEQSFEAIAKLMGEKHNLVISWQAVRSRILKFMSNLLKEHI